MENKLIVEEFTKLIKQIQHEIDKSVTDKEKNTNEFRLKQIMKVLKILKKFSKPITSSKDLEGIPGIGKGTKARIDEILETGKLSEVKLSKKTKDRLDQIEELKSVLGIGEKKAETIWDGGIKSVAELKKAVKAGTIYVDDMVKLGLKYYGKYEETIPRKEIDKVDKILQKYLHQVSKNLQGSILGSYRREHKTSNDIDFVIIHPNIVTPADLSDSNKNYLQLFIVKLKEEGYLIDHIAGEDSKKSYRGFIKLGNGYPIRRIDISFIPYESYPTSLLHFTGSSQFNEKIRKVAKTLGYKLNRYGLYKLNKNGKEKRVVVNSERDVFKKLGLDYVEPKDRDF